MVTEKGDSFSLRKTPGVRSYVCPVPNAGALDRALSLLANCGIPLGPDDSTHHLGSAIARCRGLLWLKLLLSNDAACLLQHACPGLGLRDPPDDFARESAIVSPAAQDDAEFKRAYDMLDEPAEAVAVPMRYAVLLRTARLLGVVNEVEVGQLNGFVDGQIVLINGKHECVPQPDKTDADRHDTMRHMTTFALVPALLGVRVQLRGLMCADNMNGRCGRIVKVDVWRSLDVRASIELVGRARTVLVSLNEDLVAPPDFHFSKLRFTVSLLHAAASRPVGTTNLLRD